MSRLKSRLLHVDLLRIDLSKKVIVKVPVHTHGDPVGVKLQGGQHEIITREIEIECLPDDIPESFNVDVHALTIGQSVRAGEIPLSGSMRLVSPADAVISHVIGIKAAAEETPAEAAAAPSPKSRRRARRKKPLLPRRRTKRRRSNVLCPGLSPGWEIPALSTSTRTTTWAFLRLTGWPSGMAFGLPGWIPGRCSELARERAGSAPCQTADVHEFERIVGEGAARQTWRRSRQIAGAL